ncbi:elongation factor Ts [Striga asiatica]|uniref:Elongation factor Ts, mitochondrial n=1 Tax=Striga asiatica TaxID=4170 RepID=A0A5A7QDF4_STRAF|nr:elongation factor Ts [Striga asiatica]
MQSWLLWKGNWFIQEKSCKILSLIITGRPRSHDGSHANGASKIKKDITTIDDVLKALVDWLCSQLKNPSHPSRGIPTAVNCLATLLKEPVLLYETCLCVWLLSYYEPAVEYLATSRSLPRLIEVVKGSTKEKVVRVVILTLKNLLHKGTFGAQMVDLGLPQLVQNLKAQAWSDEDLLEALNQLEEGLKDNIKQLSSFDKYKQEVLLGHLDWSPMHKDPIFWRYNIANFEEHDFQILRVLITILDTSTDPRTLAVACYDLSQFIHIGLFFLHSPTTVHFTPARFPSSSSRRRELPALNIEMAFTRGMNRPIEIIYKRLSSPVKCGHAYSTYTTSKGVSSSVSRFSEINASGFLNYSRSINNSGICFIRTYSSQISASEQMNLIKQLRERTSAPIKEVKSALVACHWDIEAAQKELRKKGVVLASKKSSRTAAEGLVAVAQDEEKAVVIELNCETDFVARNDIFQYLALSLAKTALQLERSAAAVYAQINTSVAPEYLWDNNGDVLLASLRLILTVPFTFFTFQDLKVNFDHPKLTGERTVQNAIVEVAAMMGENVKLRSVITLPAPSHGVLSTYLHTSPQPGIGRIAGLLSLEVEDKNVSLDAVQRVGSEIAMHLVAAKPLFLSKEDVNSYYLENERDIIRSQAERTGKSQMAIDKMVEGRLRKYFEEVVLLEQKFIVDDTINIKTLLNKLSKEVGSTVKIGNFLRVEVGEGHRIEAASGTEPVSQVA